jgi:hypothetical protein
MQVLQIIFPFSSDLATAKEQLVDYVKQLNGTSDKPGVKTRLIQVENIIESYVRATEKRPDDYQLYALGSYLLDDYLTDQYKHHRKDEHPFKTDNRVKKNHARHRTVFLGDRTDV